MTELRELVRRAADETVPPPFETLTRRAAVRRRQRAAGSVVAAAAAVAVVAGGIALARPDGDAHPAPAASSGPSTTVLPTSRYGLTADQVVAKGELNNYAVDRSGDLFADWTYCRDSSRCVAAWKLTRPDGTAATGLFPSEFAPHVSAGPDYFVGRFFAGRGILVRRDGTATPLHRASSSNVEPGAAMVVGEEPMLVDSRTGTFSPVSTPSPGEEWGQIAGAADGAPWGTVSIAGGGSAVAWRPVGGAWHQHRLASLSGEATYAMAGQRVAAYSLMPGSKGAIFDVAGASVTNDGGAHWQDLDPASLPFNRLESVAASADGTIFVSDGHRVYASTDGADFATVPGATGLSRLEGGDGAHPGTVYGYSYDRDELDAVTVSGASKAERQLR